MWLTQSVGISSDGVLEEGWFKGVSEPRRQFAVLVVVDGEKACWLNMFGFMVKAGSGFYFNTESLRPRSFPRLLIFIYTHKYICLHTFIVEYKYGYLWLLKKQVGKHCMHCGREPNVVRGHIRYSYMHIFIPTMFMRIFRFFMGSESAIFLSVHFSRFLVRIELFYLAWRGSFSFISSPPTPLIGSIVAIQLNNHVTIRYMVIFV